MVIEPIPQQPYFLRALYEWCVDSGYTPYVTVKVDNASRVPNAYVKGGQIVLNIGPAAVRDLNMDNAWLRFSARFGGVAQVVEVPISNILAIYAQETGEGMAFKPTEAESRSAIPEAVDQQGEAPTTVPVPEAVRPKGPPSLRVVK